jgi:hypothetical protein
MKFQGKAQGYQVESTGALFQFICALGGNGESINSANKKISALLNREVDIRRIKNSAELNSLLNEIKKTKGA